MTHDVKPNRQGSVDRPWGPLRSAMLGWTAIVLVIAVDWFVFRLLSLDYLAWYIQNGAVIAIVVGVVAAVIDLDDHDELISAHPFEYLAGLVLLLAKGSLAWAPVFAPPGRVAIRGPSLIVDWLFSNVVLAVFLAAIGLYVVVVAPLQYWVNLVTGAPARATRVSTLRPTMRLERDEHGEVRRIHFEELSRNGHLPDGVTEFGFGKKPVTTTAAISAALFLFVSAVI